jgi:hypothetical protein
MKTRRSSVLYVPATGVIVLLVTVVVLFWARWGCESARYSLLPELARRVEVDTSSLIKPEAGRDPNGIPFHFIATMEPENAADGALGIQQYRKAHEIGSPESSVYLWSRSDRDPRFYFDRSRGVMVYSSTVEAPQANGTVTLKNVVTYAGPDGIADKPGKTLGRFRDPLVRFIGGNLDRPIVYDRGLRRFFAIDWRSKTVQQGPEMTGQAFAPVVDFGWPRKQPGCLSIRLDTPEPRYTYGTKPDRALVLDAAGRINMLDLDTLAYVRSVGVLPAPATLFPSSRRATPDALFAFEVLPVFVGRGDIYAGCAVATLSRDATAMKLEVFDADGATIASGQTSFPQGGDHPRRILAAWAPYFGLPGAAALTATKFVLESLHPPVLLWRSYFTARHVEAVAGHRSLFVLPDSFAAMKGRDVGSWWLPRFTSALPFLLPGVVIGVALAQLVSRRARRAGLPVRTRRLWIAATVLFGAPAYVTYELTRPMTARVTCPNCGRDRWVDREKCHHCGSPWLVPELVPPAWRVIGRPEEQTGDDPMPRSEETISREFEV